MTCRASRAALCEKLVKGLSGFTVRLPGSFHGVDQAYKLLSCVRDCNIVVLTFSTLFGQIGNNTSVSIGDESGKITASSTYSPNGNRLVSTTDAAGNTTTYGYDAQTNLLEWVQSPEDTADSWTAYNYDSMNRVIKTTAIMEGNDPFVEYTYEDDRLSTIHTVGGTYQFAYNDFGMRTAVNIQNHGNLVSYTYTNDGNNYLSSMKYGNDDTVAYDYDDKGRLLKETYTDADEEKSEDTVEYVYDNDGNLSKVIDSASGITACYYYDLTDRLMKYTETGGDHDLTLRYTYDTKGNLTYLAETVDGEWRGIYYTYDDDNRVTRMYKGSGARAYTYDSLGRVTQKRAQHGATTMITEDFAFVTKGTALTTQVESHTITTGVGTDNAVATTYRYTYDKNGNITRIVKVQGSTETLIATYAYDTQNRLKREDNNEKQYTYTWTYDRIGNIMSRREYEYTPADQAVAAEDIKTCTYGYNTVGWEDLLESYTVTENGEIETEIVMEYDDAGNPKKYGQWAMDWVHGRQLAQMTDGTTTWDFSYNADGMRTERTNGTKTWEYVYSGSQLVKMVAPSDEGNQNLAFAYDADGVPLTVRWNGSYYYYVTNIQGDVIGITDSTGLEVVAYTYDAWGNPLSTTGTMATTLGTYNPLRYRGYVYDAETGLYYVSSRYYNPEIGRWINADDTAYLGADGTLLSYNLFAYCKNNPVNFSDPTGEFALGVILGKAAIGAAVNVLTTYIGAKVTGQSYSWKDAGVAALAGALGTGGTVLKVAAGVVSGLYTGVTAYQNGADLGKAVLAGVVSAWGTTVSVANIAGWTGPALELGVSTFTDVVFGTASNSIAAATYRTSIETSTSNNTKQQVGTQCANNLKRTKLYCDKRLR